MNPTSGLPLVSVVIPTRNRRRLLAEAIESVRRQSYPHWELIVVDDCSEDDTWVWLSSLADPRIRAVRLGHHSERSAARNRGLAGARGDYVLFLDDDDLLVPEALTVLAGAMDRFPHVVGAAGAVEQFDARGHSRRLPWVRRARCILPWPTILWGWWILQGQAAIKRETLVAVGGWDPGLAGPEDQELWLRLGLRGPVVLVPNLVLKNRFHSTWRGVDTPEVEQVFRERFVRRLEGADLVLAGRVLSSREHFEVAVSHYQCAEWFAGLMAVARAVRAAPDITLGPPLRGRVLGLMARLLLGLLTGSKGVGLVRVGVREVRRRLRMSPEGVAVLSGSAIVGGQAINRRVAGSANHGATSRPGSG